MDLLLIRHGEPVRVEGGDGPADPALTRAGVQQAIALAEWLADEPLAALYSSPLCRARQTAAAVARQRGLDVRVDDGLAEFDRHARFYVPVEELRARRDERWRDLARGRLDAFGETDPRAFQTRVVATVEALVDANPASAVAVVAHGGVINAYLAHVLRTASMLFFEPAYTSVSRVLAGRTGERTVRSLNETAHLRIHERSPAHA